MPFTLSHPAAVLPLARQLNRRNALSAAVIGSMVPDFAFFLPWRLPRVETHSLLGLFTFCLPVALLTYWLFEYLVKPASFEVLPAAARARARAFRAPDPITSLRQWAVAVAAILFGAATHLFLDAFTHEGARGVRMIPILDDPFAIAGHSLLLFKVLQLSSSVLGLAVVAYVIWAAMKDSGPLPAPSVRRLSRRERRAWMGLYAAVALGVAIASSLQMSRHALQPPSWLLVDFAAIGILRGLMISLFGVSLLLRVRLYRSS